MTDQGWWIAHIEGQADGEPIEFVRFGADLEGNTDPTLPGRLVSWEEAQPILTTGEANADYWTWSLLAWTASWVIFTHDYDTMRDFYRLPRYPEGAWPGECVGNG